MHAPIALPEDKLPVIKSAIAGALTFGAAFLAVFVTAWMLGLLGLNLFRGLWVLGFCWALSIGGGSGAFSAAAFNLTSHVGKRWPGATAAYVRSPG